MRIRIMRLCDFAARNGGCGAAAMARAARID
jgi:hypothetical protein